METLKAIETRRSIREFLEKDVSNDLLKKIIEAGMRAPSAKNIQNWYFIILKSNKKNEVIDLVEKEFKNNWRLSDLKMSQLESCKLTRNAPVLILIFNKAPWTGCESKIIEDCTLDSLQHWTEEIQGISAAIQNMLLAIHDLGLGGVWLADFNFARKNICKHLKCKYDLIAGVALGYPAYKLPPRKIPELKLNILE